MTRALVVARSPSLLGACAPPPVRFADRAILWRDPDDAPVPLPPRARGRARPLWAGADNAIFRPAERFFNVDYGARGGQRQRARRGARLVVVDDPRARSAPTGRAAARAVAAEVLSAAPATAKRRAAAVPHHAPASAGGSAAGFVVDDALGRTLRAQVRSRGPPRPHHRRRRGRHAPGVGVGLARPRRRRSSTSRAAICVVARRDHARRVGRQGAARRRRRRRDPRHARARRRRPLPRRRQPLDRRPHPRPVRRGSAATTTTPTIATRTRTGATCAASASGPRGSTTSTSSRTTRSTATSASPAAATSCTTSSTSAARSASFSGAPAHYWMGDQSYFQADRIVGALFTARLRAAIAGRIRAGSGGARALVERVSRVRRLSTPSTSSRARGGPSSTSRRSCGRRAATATGAPSASPRSRATSCAPPSPPAHYRPAAAEYLVETLWRRRERIARDAFAETRARSITSPSTASGCASSTCGCAPGSAAATATDYRAREERRDLGVVARRGSRRRRLPDAAAARRLPRGRAGGAAPGRAPLRPARGRPPRRARNGHARIVGVAR